MPKIHSFLPFENVFVSNFKKYLASLKNPFLPKIYSFISLRNTSLPTLKKYFYSFQSPFVLLFQKAIPFFLPKIYLNFILNSKNIFFLVKNPFFHFKKVFVLIFKKYLASLENPFLPFFQKSITLSLKKMPSYFSKSIPPFILKIHSFLPSVNVFQSTYKKYILSSFFISKMSSFLFSKNTLSP